MTNVLIGAIVGGFVGAFAGVVSARAAGAWTVYRALERMKREATTAQPGPGPFCLREDPEGRPCLRLAGHAPELAHCWGPATADSARSRP